MIGYACKWVSALPDAKARLQEEKEYNGSYTTARWCETRAIDEVRSRLLALARLNVSGMHRFVTHAASLPPEGRMIRFGSGILPLYTHPTHRDWWMSAEIQSELQSWFRVVGDDIKRHHIKTSWHPDHFVVMASESEVIRDRSREELEYHGRMVEMLGLTDWPLQSKINIHLSGKLGGEQFLIEYDKLNDITRQNVTVENSDVGRYGINESIALARVPLVLDVHHHWCMTGEYLTPDHAIWDQVRRTWRHAPTDPTIHFAMSKRELLGDEMPDRDLLFAAGQNVTTLRAHSDDFDHVAMIDYMKTWAPVAHIMLECKLKNQAQARVLREIAPEFILKSVDIISQHII